MFYEQMEKMLVQRIAEVRASEISVLRAIQEGSDHVGNEYTRLQEQLTEVEGLLAAMDSSSLSVPSFVPETGQQVFAPVWA